MKIRSIVFTNLNSLRGSHRLDFIDGPLGKTGIFAITGPTGAGKSTIMDAITLALFGKAARYRGNINETEMMSRGTGEASSEIEFQSSGMIYRASWSVNRAKKKPDGKMQAVQRHIIAQDGKGLAKGIKECNALIENIIGLDSERFFRSAMLAQGEFARFLQAKEDERAALLESLTDTEIYSHISMATFAAFRERENDKKVLEAKLNSIELLTQEQHDEINTAVAKCNADEIALNQQTEIVKSRLNRLQNIAKLNVDIERNSNRRLEFVNNQAALKDDKQRLQMFNASRNFSQPLTKYLSLQERLKSQQNEVSVFASKLIAEQEKLTLNTFAARSYCLEKQVVVIEEKTRSQRAIETTVIQQQQLSEFLSTNALDAKLDAQLPNINTALTRITKLKNEIATTESLRENRVKVIEESNEEHRSLEGQKNEHEALLKTQTQLHVQAALSLDKILNGKTQASLNIEITAAEHRILSLDKLRELHENQLKSGERIIESQTTIATFELQLGDCKKDLDRLEETHQVREQLVDTLTTSLEKSKLIKKLEHHRADLVTGESCPLCGAIEHPYVIESLPSEDSADAQKLKSAKLELKKNQEALRIAVASLATAESQLSIAKMQYTTLTRDQSTLQREIAQASDLLHVIDPTATNIDLASQETIKHKKILESLRDEVSEKLTNVSDLHHSVQREEELFTLANQAVIKSSKRIENYGAQILNDATKIESLQADLADAITAFNDSIELWRPSLDGATDPITLVEQLTLADKKYRSKSSEYRIAQTQIQTLQAEFSQIELVQKKLETLQHFCDQLTTEFQLTDTLENSIAKTETHVKNPEIASHIDESTANLQSVATQFRMQKSLQSSQTNKLIVLQKEFDANSVSLEDSLIDSVFKDLEELISASKMSDHEAVEAAIQNVEQELHTLANTLEELSVQLNALLAQAEADKDQSIEDLQNNIADLKTQLDSVRTIHSDFKAKLRANEENLRRQADDVAKVQQFKQSLVTLERLNKLIGSADGKKFRTYAQGLVLDHLIRNANLHLQRFNDRYLLGRCENTRLEIEICDKHQANAMRPMASLSGGESFLVSLALALGLSELSGANVQIDSLFIDEGFGTLDPDSLDTAIAALEALRTNNKTIGVISHVELLKERIRTQIQVHKLHSGCSTLEVVS